MRNTFLAVMAIFCVLGCRKEQIEGGDEGQMAMSDVLCTFSIADSLETKSPEAISPEAFLSSGKFNAVATYGTSGNESRLWPASGGIDYVQFNKGTDGKYSSGKCWPEDERSYHFYASNSSKLKYEPNGACITIDNIDEDNLDVVCAYLASPLYKITNKLTFEHILSRVGTVNFINPYGYTNASISLTAPVSGTYYLRTKSWTAGAAVKKALPIGSDNDLWIVPGTYSLTLSYTDNKGQNVSLSQDVVFPAGYVNGITCSYESIICDQDTVGVIKGWPNVIKLRHNSSEACTFEPDNSIYDPKYNLSFQRLTDSQLQAYGITSEPDCKYFLAATTFNAGNALNSFKAEGDSKYEVHYTDIPVKIWTSRKTQFATLTVRLYDTSIPVIYSWESNRGYPDKTFNDSDDATHWLERSSGLSCSFKMPPLLYPWQNVFRWRGNGYVLGTMVFVPVSTGAGWGFIDARHRMIGNALSFSDIGSSTTVTGGGTSRYDLKDHDETSAFSAMALSLVNLQRTSCRNDVFKNDVISTLPCSTVLNTEETFVSNENSPVDPTQIPLVVNQTIDDLNLNYTITKKSVGVNLNGNPVDNTANNNWGCQGLSLVKYVNGSPTLYHSIYTQEGTVVPINKNLGFVHWYNDGEDGDEGAIKGWIYNTSTYHNHNTEPVLFQWNATYKCYQKGSLYLNSHWISNNYKKPETPDVNYDTCLFMLIDDDDNISDNEIDYTFETYECGVDFGEVITAKNLPGDNWFLSLDFHFPSKPRGNEIDYHLRIEDEKGNGLSEFDAVSGDERTIILSYSQINGLPDSGGIKNLYFLLEYDY